MVPPARSSRASSGLAWHAITPAPIVLIAGAERLLGDRARDLLVSQVREKDPDVEITEVDAAAYESGGLATLVSPSLFAEDKLVIVDGVESCTDAFLSDALDYLAEPSPEAIVLLRHGGGQRGKRLLDALKKAKVPTIDAQPLKSDADKQSFAAEEFARAGRTIDTDAMAALMNAVGADVSELAAGVRQLVDDTSGKITAELVDRYYGGRVEATGFKVADAAVAGRVGDSLSLLRHALATGTDPVPMVAAMAMKLRQMAKVSGLRGGSGALAGQLKMAPWQVDVARKSLARWDEDLLADALIEVAEADAAVKGGSRDAVYALERMVTRVARNARGRR